MWRRFNPEVLCFQFGFRKWKGHVTEKPIEDRSDIVKELYSDLSIVKPQEGLLSFSFICLGLHSSSGNQ